MIGWGAGEKIGPTAFPQYRLSHFVKNLKLDVQHCFDAF